MAEIFQESFCRRFNVAPERYIDAVLRRTLTLRTRMLRPLLQICDRDFFAADREFIAGVGQLTPRGDFRGETMDFRYHPGNRGFLRRTLRLRVSAYRMRCLVEEVWPDFAARRSVATPTLSPFSQPGEPPGSASSARSLSDLGV